MLSNDDSVLHERMIWENDLDLSMRIRVRVHADGNIYNTSVVQFYSFSQNHYNPTVSKNVQLSEDFIPINIMVLNETICNNLK